MKGGFIMNSEINKIFPGSIVVGKSVQTKNVVTDNINGKEIDNFITTDDIPNAETLDDFKEEDGGLIWKGVPLVPPNSVMEDRAYTSDEMTELVNSLWDEYDGSVEDDEISKEVNASSGDGSVSTDWTE